MPGRARPGPRVDHPRSVGPDNRPGMKLVSRGPLSGRNVMTFAKSIKLGAAAAVLATGVSFGAMAQEHTLRIQTHYAPETPSGKLAQAFIVVAGTSLAACADQSAKRSAPASPSAPFSAMPMRIQLS